MKLKLSWKYFFIVVLAIIILCCFLHYLENNNLLEGLQNKETPDKKTNILKQQSKDEKKTLTDLGNITSDIQHLKKDITDADLSLFKEAMKRKKKKGHNNPHQNDDVDSHNETADEDSNTANEDSNTANEDSNKGKESFANINWDSNKSCYSDDIYAAYADHQLTGPLDINNFFGSNIFKPEYCSSPGGSNYSSSSGCPGMTLEQLKYLNSRGGNRTFYSEY